jgi:hypothetical protein
MSRDHRRGSPHAAPALSPRLERPPTESTSTPIRIPQLETCPWPRLIRGAPPRKLSTRTQTTLARTATAPSHVRQQHPRRQRNSTQRHIQHPRRACTHSSRHTPTHNRDWFVLFGRHNQRSTRRKHPFHFATSLRVRIQEARRVVGKTNAVTSLQRHSECSPLVPVSNFPGSAPIVLNTYTKRSGGEKRGSAEALTLVTTQPTGRRSRWVREQDRRHVSQ